MKISVYNTPRKVIMEYLNNNTDETAVKWRNKKTGICWMHTVRMREIWMEKAISNESDRKAWDETESEEYFCEQYSNTLSVVTYGEDYTYSVANDYHVGTIAGKVLEYMDLKPAPLHCWLIKLLLEETRKNWIQFIDRDKLEFFIFDIEAIANLYVKVNGIHTNCPISNIKYMLTGYCLTGILEKIDSYYYKFDRAWYEQELKAEGEFIRESYDDICARDALLYPEYIYD